VFCHQRRALTKGHVWPAWIGEVMPFDQTHHVQTIGHIETFKPQMRVPAFERHVRQGHGTTRKPRNTCKVCNGGWMSKIESAAKPSTTRLMHGNTLILDRIQQMLVATLLCLIAVRNEFSALGARGVSEQERMWLRTRLTPPWNWQIWVARYAGSRPNEHWCYHYPLHIASTPTAETGPDKCNTQTTTLAVGELCAHLFSSTEILDFPGYQGIHLCKIWPPGDLLIDWRLVPAYEEPVLMSLAESLSRDTSA
jgi:hypothetical protein